MTSLKFFLLVAFSLYAADSYQVNVGQTVNINEHSISKDVTNDTCGASVFVPTKTSVEWTAFISNAPPCTTVVTAPACPNQTIYWSANGANCEGQYFDLGSPPSIVHATSCTAGGGPQIPGDPASINVSCVGGVVQQDNATATCDCGGGGGL